MSPVPFARLTLPDADSTTAFGARLAPLLRPGDALLLVGDIGAGKSLLSRAIVQTRLAELNRIEDVPSPTFTLVQTYELEDCDLWHCDLYRLSGPEEVDALGLDEAAAENILLIEWPDRLGGHLPPDPLVVSLTMPDVDGAGRELHLTALGGDWTTRLAPCLDTLK